MLTASKYLPIPRLDSIRNRILVFAVTATLLPSGITLWISYAQNRSALEAKTAQALVAESEQTSRAMAVWLKERLYDLRVFAGSDEVSGNLDRATRRAAGSPTRGRLHDYLESLHERFSDYEQLLVVDGEGRVVATSARSAAPVRLPDGWLEALRAEGQLVGDVYWDEAARAGKLIVALPVQRPDGRLLGAFAAELNIRPVEEMLRAFVSDTTGAVHLMSAGGAVLASSRGVSAQLMKARLERATLERLMRSERDAVPYPGFGGREVVGILKPVPQVRWAILAEVPSDAAFLQVRQFRDVALLVVTVLLLVAAAGAYRFGLIIVGPLDRLTRGAAEVAAGDLAVDLPVAGGGEVGELTSVFNHMVSRLRASRQELDATNETLRRQNEELERLSLTDGLTGLANRRSLMQRLNEEALRYRRTRRDLAVLMLDVDHFKKYNDTFGHPAGDEVLKRVAAILQATAREVDCVARYGGEEFCLMLPETPASGAAALAERIRARVAAAELPGQTVTLSVGVASFPADGDTPDAVIAAADGALYQAKHDGRNRVVEARRARTRDSSAPNAG